MRGQGLYLGNERLLSVPLFAVQPDGSSNQVSCSISSDRVGVDEANQSLCNRHRTGHRRRSADDRVILAIVNRQDRIESCERKQLTHPQIRCNQGHLTTTPTQCR